MANRVQGIFCKRREVVFFFFFFYGILKIGNFEEDNGELSQGYNSNTEI